MMRSERAMNLDAFRVPTDAEIDRAEQVLGLPFHPDYRTFLKSGSTVANAGFEPAIVLPSAGYLYLVEMAKTAWKDIGVPKSLLPFVENNGDYYCLTQIGEVVYWSHDRAIHERWSTLTAWHQQMCLECGE